MSDPTLGVSSTSSDISRSKCKRLYLRVGLVVFSFLISSLLVEMVFKFNLKSRERFLNEKCIDFDRIELVESRGFSLLHGYYEPLDVVNHCGPEWNYTYCIDSDGFRSSEKPPIEGGILAIGDSFTFGFGVQDGESFPAILDAYNAGMWGNPFDVQFVSLKRNIDLVHPKVILWGIYPSHIITMMPKEWSDRCPGDWTYFIGDSVVSKVGRWLSENIMLPLSNKSYFAKYIILKRLNISAIKIVSGGVDIHKNCYSTKEILLYDNNLETTVYTSNREIDKTFSADIREVYEKIGGYFAEAKKLSDESGTKVYFIIIPSRLNLKLKEGSYHTAYKGSDIDPDLPLQNFKRIIAASGFDDSQVIDLSSLFIDSGDWRKYYFKEDAHWNSEGHKFVAEILKEIMDSNENK